MNESLPLVSVIVPVYNGSAHLPGALRSIIKQTYRPLELIVVDDGSTDGSGRIAADFLAANPHIPFKVLSQANSGPSRARNLGITRAGGDFIAFLDADDEWLGEKIQRQVQIALENPGEACVTCRIGVIYEGEASWIGGAKLSRYKNNPPAHLPSALLASRKVFERVGGFDENYRRGEDTDWFMRVLEADIPIRIAPEVLLLRRLRRDSLSNTDPDSNGRLLLLFRASLKRRGLLGARNEEPAGNESGK